MDDECIHGFDPALCGTCTGTDYAVTSSTGTYGFHGGATKQDLLTKMCRQLGVRVQTVGVGSSLPSDVFEEAARRVGVPLGSMPDIGYAIASKAGFPWGPGCDSTGSVSGGGSTVTAEGLEVIVKALDKLL